MFKLAVRAQLNSENRGSFRNLVDNVELRNARNESVKRREESANRREVQGAPVADLYFLDPGDLNIWGNNDREPSELQKLESRVRALTQNWVPQEDVTESQLDDFFLYTSISGLRFLHSKNPGWFKVLRENYSPDFAHFLTNFWLVHDEEPVVQNKTLRQWLEELNNELQQIRMPILEIARLDEWSQEIARILPNAANMLNISGALKVLGPDFQVEGSSEFYAFQRQSDECSQVLDFTKNETIAGFIACRLYNVRVMIGETLNSYNYLIKTINDPPLINDYIMECKWIDGTDCALTAINTTLNMICIRAAAENPFNISGETTRLAQRQGEPIEESLFSRQIDNIDTFSVMSFPVTIVIDSQAFNNQANTFKPDEVKVAFYDDNTEFPRPTQFATFGGSDAVELDISAVQDFYQYGSDNCDWPQVRRRTKPVDKDEVCIWRNYRFSVTLSEFRSDQNYKKMVHPQRKLDWKGIDKVLERSDGEVFYPLLTRRLKRLNDISIDAHLNIGKMIQSKYLKPTFEEKFAEQIRTKVEPIPISPECLNVRCKVLVNNYFQASLYNNLKQAYFEAYGRIIAKERAFTGKVGDSYHGYASMFLYKRRFSHTKTLRYYRTKDNQRQLIDYIAEVQNIFKTANKSIHSSGICREILPMLNSLMASEMFGELKGRPGTSRFMNAYGRIAQRRDVRVIQKDYISQNFMSLETRFRTLDREVVSRAPEYGIYQFIADLGGTMGLYFGLSFLTFYEFLVFMFVKDAAIGNEPPPKRTIIYNGEKRKATRKNRDCFSAEMRKPKVV
ncbi:unnamed protein product [Bursaphelenchus xylophilus]|uniref:(pine wood nematode) hypothetical protein n=1 Tax=Bursaphelenchus xylophilus TaxID=6326 RepID=A0A1I7RIG3_BURXY|nr:unnamed protein product [Bursaphelenchus xylophilus]CAG9080786.1 unnamed protein product [Bursaphelenchus xylophilus]